MTTYHLYVKTHRLTGLKYLGITKRKDPHKYTGSGKYWRYHLKVHGSEYETQILLTTTDLNELSTTGLHYSNLWNIVESNEWANLKPECGYDTPDTSGFCLVRDQSDNHLLVKTNDLRLKTGELIYAQTGYTNVRNSDGSIRRVSVTDPTFLSGELPHFCAGTCVVRDSNGKSFRVAIDDPRLTTGELTHLLAGKTNVQDVNGNRFQVSTDDPRYLSRELVGCAKGLTAVRDKSGRTFSVPTDDPMVKSGELLHVNKGFFLGRDKEGNKYRVSKDDPRVLSGDIIAASKGRKYQQIECPHCNKKGSPLNMKRWHFDQCKLKPTQYFF